MKIGILTYHNIPNIGAILQAQALCQFIRNCGFDCEIIDYSCCNLIRRELTFHSSSNPLTNLLLRYAWNKNKKKIKGCNMYMSNLHFVSLEKYNRQTIQNANLIYDLFISGSDMIWNLAVNGEDYTYFLDFVDNNKLRISFASSIGDVWTDEEKDKLIPLLKKYNSISVREEDTNVILNNMGLLSHHLCDPTFLLEPDVWKKHSIKPNKKGYVLVYFPTDELISKAKLYAKKHSLKVIVISQGIPSFNVTKFSPNNPGEWIGLFEYADAVFTNSYHGLLFSFYFEKPVWTANYGNRILSILKLLNQNKCRLDVDYNMNNVIDYTDCRSRISRLRRMSQEYIKQTLYQFS